MRVAVPKFMLPDNPFALPPDIELSIDDVQDEI
jgi:hypothetical protein